MRVKTAQDFTEYLAFLLDYENDVSGEAEELWMKLKVGNVYENNVIVTLPDDTQFKVQVKKVSK